MTKTTMRGILLLAVMFCFIAWLPHAFAADEEFGVFDRDSDTAVVMPVKSFSEYKIFTLDDPYRIVVDVATNDERDRPTRQYSSASPRIKKIRTSLREGLFRFVYETAPGVAVSYHGILEPYGNSGSNDRIVMMTLANRDKVLRSAPAAAAANILGLDDAEPGPFADPDAPNSAPAPVPVRKPGAYNPLIVVDAGHGGKDPGARGLHKGTIEKDVTLAYAVALARKLEASGRYKARLTRKNDEYIPLIDRVRIAERLDADFFVSVHADSIPSKKDVRGLSVYTLSDTASDAQTAALAQHENFSGGSSGADGALDDDVTSALFRLVQRDTMNRSALFSENLLDAARRNNVNLLRNPHRFAGFRVLTGAKVPSALIELGFLSNAKDEKALRSSDHKHRISQTVLDTMDAIFYPSNDR